MIPIKIGIIGNTQGVKASSKPAPKNISSVNKVLPLRSALLISSCSETASDTFSPVEIIVAACASEMGDSRTVNCFVCGG